MSGTTHTWTYLLIFYFVVLTVFVSLLSIGGQLTEDESFTTNSQIDIDAPIYQVGDTPTSTSTICHANGSVNFEEPNTLLFTYDPSDIDLGTNCLNFCRNESSLFVHAMSCPGLCLNLTNKAGTQLTYSCAPQDDTWNFVRDVMGFFIWGISLNIGGWMWIIRIFFVYLPLLALSLSVYYSLRSGG